MKVCLILEGCYPYVRGGVSAWAHQYITSSPEVEFILWTIHASQEDARTPLYTLPENVTAHHHVFLSAPRATRMHFRHNAAQKRAVEAIREVLHQQEGGWENLMDSLRAIRGASGDLTLTPEFLELAREMSAEKPGLALADAFYGLRSMFSPIEQVLHAQIPEADLYHSAVAGYGGLLAALAAHVTGKPMILTEHGIYPREREEELLSADWAVSSMLPLWTQLFYSMSRCAYRHASRVTSLFEGAMERQVSIGCSKDKCVIIPNGIRSEIYTALPPPPGKKPLRIGAFVRFAAIKDIKTMIHAFATLHAAMPETVLHLMGGTDDAAYYDACLKLIRRLKLEESILVEGHVNTVEYMRRMDLTLLSSISEGQPLSLLEAMAAGRPCVATRVGNCEGLLTSPMADVGPAGICCTPMSPDEIAQALLTLCQDAKLRKNMGNNGRQRVAGRYQLDRMLNEYHQLYEEVCRNGGNRV